MGQCPERGDASYGPSVAAIVSQGMTESCTTAKLDLSAPDVAHLSYETEPFWSDMIFVAMHPQFALWDYPGGVKLQPLGCRNPGLLGAGANRVPTQDWTDLLRSAGNAGEDRHR
jgi:hypothetical protein